MMLNCGSGPFSQHQGHEGCDLRGHDSKDELQPIVLDTDSEEVDSYTEDSSGGQSISATMGTGRPGF
jgi:hypothetical protein